MSNKANVNYQLSVISSLFTVYCLLLTVVLSGCIALEPKDDPVKRDIDGLKRSMAVEQQKLVRLEEEIKKSSELQTKRFDAADEARQREKAGVNASIDKIREDMAFIRGRFDEATQAAKKANEEAAAIREKTDSELKARNSEQSNRLASIQEQLATLEKKLTALDEKIASLEHAKMSSVPEEVQKQVDKQEAKHTKPDELYDEAIKLIKDKDYSNALEKFSRFISLFSAHDLASNAQYWIGEIYYAQKDYERAVLEFNEVVQKYPKGKKVSAALLKQGMA
ncbi:MAG: tol-pal system protein YbgF, partial [Deltaproteobacteria bacterium]|nr:tol-pal system protein YbgF [Deltaproteobacteria bacterium]